MGTVPMIVARTTRPIGLAIGVLVGLGISRFESSDGAFKLSVTFGIYAVLFGMSAPLYLWTSWIDPVLVEDAVSSCKALRSYRRLRFIVGAFLCPLGISTSLCASIGLVAVVPTKFDDERLALWIGAAGLLGAMAFGFWYTARRLEQPLAWLCPNVFCTARRMTELDVWRCACCQLVNSATHTNSFLTRCGGEHCHERPSGFICPACGHILLFDREGDRRFLATAPGTTAPATRIPMEERRRLAEKSIAELKELEAVEKLEAAARQLKESFSKFAANLPKSKIEAARDLMLKYEQIEDFNRRKLDEIESSEGDAASKERRQQLLSNLVEDMLDEVDRSREQEKAAS